MINISKLLVDPDYLLKESMSLRKAHLLMAAIRVFHHDTINLRPPFGNIIRPLIKLHDIALQDLMKPVRSIYTHATLDATHAKG